MGTSDNSMVEQISKKMGMTMQISISKTTGKSMVEDEANGITVLFSKEHLCEEENLYEIWKEEVEAVFESHGLSCKLKWNEGKMTVNVTERTRDPEMISKGARALFFLACGLSTQWVELILSGSIYNDIIRLEKPDGVSEEDFSRKYDYFIAKFDDEFGLADKWSCYVGFHDSHVIVLADSFKATWGVRHLVRKCLLGNVPFNNEHSDVLFPDI
ncbi:hypothetical protein M0R45_025141 [Rubus argutus]|uniref:KRR1 small subunit processome component first KH domain-containing protein n=1 Tax=Rubus argutus TaxID=59490 RepID=A0AAW1WTK6_RUBAR